MLKERLGVIHIAPQTGKDQAALFRFQQPVAGGPDGLEFVATLDQRFGSNQLNLQARFQLEGGQSLFRCEGTIRFRRRCKEHYAPVGQIARARP